VIQYVLPGSRGYQERIYPNPSQLDPRTKQTLKLDTYQDVIAHFTKSSLAEDGIQIEEGSLAVTQGAGDAGYTVSFEPLPAFGAQAAQFIAMHAAMLDETHLMGVRVPTIVVSPWIEAQTVFRSPTPVAYDSTSFMATLLQWYGIPKSRWGLGARTANAPSFEGVLQRASPRPDAPSFTPPYDKAFPRNGARAPGGKLHDLHRLMAPRLVAALVSEKLSAQETSEIANDILARATDLKTLHALVDDLAKRMR
jgi:Phosphoesterase family